MRVAWGTVVGRGWEGLYTTLCSLFGGVGGCGLWYWAALLPWGGGLAISHLPLQQLAVGQWDGGGGGGGRCHQVNAGQGWFSRHPPCGVSPVRRASWGLVGGCGWRPGPMVWGGEPLSGSCSPGETPVLASVLLIPSSKMPQKSSGEKPNINSSALTILRVVFL